jgi:sirohydrochlorin ferrochelatase
MDAPSKIALVVIDHGSRSEAANSALDMVARQIARLAGDRYLAVLPAHLEIASPTIADAFDSAVAAGAGLVVVVLYFLGPGRHSFTDVPKLAAEAAARHPGLRFCITNPLGPDPVLVALALERVTEALQKTHY